jgi:phosphoglycerate dehydrogenase-like enzyme
MGYRCAVLDDYQQVALKMADWSVVGDEIDITVFNKGFSSEVELIEALSDFEILCVMRERTPLPGSILGKLPKLRLIVTTGLRNASIDIEAAKSQGIVVCGTESAVHPTAELTFALLLEVVRHVGAENSRMKSGMPWQSVIGQDLNGRVFGVIGLGRLGTRVARIGQVFGMNVIAWSQNLTPERCAEAGVGYASKEELLATADFVTIHLQLSERTSGLIGTEELARMKPTAYLINTSRGPIIDEAALLEALKEGTIAGAGLDVYDLEPLPLDHELRSLPNVVISPHLGYVTADNYRIFYSQTVEAIRSYLKGSPIRVIT